MRTLLVTIIFFFCLIQNGVGQTLPIKWEVSVVDPTALNTVVNYVGNIDNDASGELMVSYQYIDSSRVHILDGSNGLVKYQWTCARGSTRFSSYVRLAPSFRYDFNGSGISDVLRSTVDMISIPIEFLDAATGARTVDLAGMGVVGLVDADDIDNDGIYELITVNSSSGNTVLRSYNTGRSVTGVQQSRNSPESVQLMQNYPNPFNPTTTIQYQLSAESNVVLEVFDLTGRNVRTFAFPGVEAGTHEVTWDGKNSNGISVSSGTYFYRLGVNGNAQAKKMLLLR